MGEDDSPAREAMQRGLADVERFVAANLDERRKEAAARAAATTEATV